MQRSLKIAATSEVLFLPTHAVICHSMRLKDVPAYGVDPWSWYCRVIDRGRDYYLAFYPKFFKSVQQYHSDATFYLVAMVMVGHVMSIHVTMCTNYTIHPSMDYKRVVLIGIYSVSRLLPNHTA